MSFSLPVLLLALLLLLLAARAHANPRRQAVNPSEVDCAALLAALADVESGNDPHAIGKLGERSAWQIMPGSWAMHSRFPHRIASERPDIARAVAALHLDWTMETLRRRQVRLDVELIAAGWRHGPGFAQRFARSDYALRVGNLYRANVAKKARGGR
jgi:hypothetical protein